MWKSWERIGIERYINYLSNEGSLSIGGLLVKQSDSSKNLSLQPPLLPPSRLLGQDVCCDQQGAAGINRGWRMFPGTVLYCTVLCSKVLDCTVLYSTILDVLGNFPDLLKRQITIFTILLKYSPQHVSALALFTCAGLLSKFLPPQGTKAWFGSSLSQMSHIHFH